MKNLKTERMTIRELTLADVDGWMEYFNSPLALQFMPFELSSREMCTQVIERQINRYAANDYDGLHALIDNKTGALVGQCGLLIQEVDGVKELEIGYHLIPRFWKKGYATEAAKRFKEYAFENNLSESLVSIIHINNVNSQQVASRNGMKPEKETVYKDMPVVIYRITKTEFKKAF
jgi:RimJ/RimL family protein N-acetyltransferase